MKVSGNIVQLKVSGSISQLKVSGNIVQGGAFNWAELISATVENAAPTKVVMTFLQANTSLLASDFTIAGKTITLLERDVTNKILTLVLSIPVLIYNETLIAVFVKTGRTTIITNNVLDDGNTAAWYDSQDLSTITKDVDTSEVSLWGDKIGTISEGAEYVLFGDNEVQKTTLTTGRVTTAQSNEQAHVGTYSSKVIHSVDVGVHYISVGCVAERQYNVSVWVYIPSGQANVDTITLGSAGGGNFASTNTKDQWIELSAVCTPTYDSISLASGFSDSSTQYWYIDDFTIKEVDVNRNFMQLEATKYPIHSINGITFDGSNDYLQTKPFTLPQPASIYMVIKINEYTGDNILDAAWRNSLDLYPYITDFKTYISMAGSSFASTVLIEGYNYFILRVVLNGDPSTIQINNYDAETGVGATSNLDGLTLGAKYNLGNNSAISVMEIITRGSKDSQETSDWICNYMSTKYEEKLKLYGNFVPYVSNPILEPTAPSTYATFASVLKVDSTYHMYYHATINGFQVVSHATSSDGKNWVKDTANDPVLSRTVGEWDEGGTGVPIVWKEGAVWYMLYRGALGGNLDAMGLATSSDGITWTKDATNPVLEPGAAGTWDENGAEGWGLIKVVDTYYMFYEASSTNGRAIGIATSTDLINWGKDANNPIMSYGRFCPNIFKYDSYYYLLVPHYSYQSDYSEIEIYRDINPTFYSADREYLGSIKKPSVTGWDSKDQDTPWVLTDDIFRNTFVASNNEIWCYYSGDAGADNWGEGLLISKNFPV